MNHDLVNRAALRGTHQFIVLLGEGVFHQFHGGVATNVRPQEHPMRDFQAEYASIRGSRYKPVPIRDVMYFGTLPASAKRFVARDPK